mmetsp:Transcript_14018/g.29050  ORF Transcript_14018/g.29050 Transcript_14018/m.29050 type:complete len:270 (+) Transcript_14018:2102-2911(+)
MSSKRILEVHKARSQSMIHKSLARFLLPSLLLRSLLVVGEQNPPHPLAPHLLLGTDPLLRLQWHQSLLFLQCKQRGTTPRHLQLLLSVVVRDGTVHRSLHPDRRLALRLAYRPHPRMFNPRRLRGLPLLLNHQYAHHLHHKVRMGNNFLLLDRQANRLLSILAHPAEVPLDVVVAVRCRLGCPNRANQFNIKQTNKQSQTRPTLYCKAKEHGMGKHKQDIKKYSLILFNEFLVIATIKSCWQNTEENSASVSHLGLCCLFPPSYSRQRK